MAGGDRARLERLLFGGLAAVLLVGGGVLWAIGLVPLPTPIDFADYYGAARLLSAGESPYAGTNYLYAPWFAGVLRPLAMLGLPTANVIWLALNLTCYAVGMYCLLRLFELPPAERRAALAVAVLWPALQWTLERGQVTTQIFVLLAAALLLLRDGRDSLWAGVLIGVAGALKLYPLALLVPLLVFGYGWACAGAGLALAAALMLGLVIGGGWPVTAEWLFVVLPDISGGAAPIVMNQSVQASLARIGVATPYEPLFAGAGTTIPALIDAPSVFTVLGRLAAAGIALVTGWAIWRARAADAPERARLLQLTLTMSLLMTPIVWYDYYVLLLLPLGWLLATTADGTQERRLLLIAVLLVIVQRFWRLTALLDTPLLLMAGTLGTLLVWGLMLRRGVTRGAGVA